MYFREKKSEGCLPFLIGWSRKYGSSVTVKNNAGSIGGLPGRKMHKRKIISPLHKQPPMNLITSKYPPSTRFIDCTVLAPLLSTVEKKIYIDICNQ